MERIQGASSSSVFHLQRAFHLADARFSGARSRDISLPLRTRGCIALLPADLLFFPSRRPLFMAVSWILCIWLGRRARMFLVRFGFLLPWFLCVMKLKGFVRAEGTNIHVDTGI